MLQDNGHNNINNTTTTTTTSGGGGISTLNPTPGQHHLDQMPPPPKAPILKAAQPRHAASFDPWNSTSTGHQRPDSNPGTGWRESRSKKLNSQFGGGSTGGERMSDTWGAGSEDWDSRHKTLIPKAVRERARRSVMDMLVQPGKMQESLGKKAGEAEEAKAKAKAENRLTAEEARVERRTEDEEREARAASRGLFDGVVVYVNGSTFPLVSDHKLKHLLMENGGQMSIHLGRRRVTHVILGQGGAGGVGLAGAKMEKEVKRLRGCGVKFVGVEWVLESLKAGKRLPEARFSNKMASKGQGSVYGTYSKQVA